MVETLTKALENRPATDRLRPVIEDLYAIMLDEVRQPQYEAAEIALFKDPIYYYGRYLDPTTRQYALQNVLSNVSAAIDYLNTGDASSMKLLDLGCGLGMQSLIFASLGWEVLGVDLDPACVAICRKRKAYFEARLGRELRMNFLAHHFRTLEPGSLDGKYNALFSMSAFAYMHPLEDTVSKVSDVLSDTGRVLIWDQNPGCLFLDRLGLRHKPIPGPGDISKEFARQGFTIDLLRGACAVPRQFWLSDAFVGVASRLNNVLKKSLRLSFTYLLGASRGKDGRE
jgi:SAM-dependent methyltransferase